MSRQSKPWISRGPCVAVTTKKFNKATGDRTFIELRSLREGQFMVVTAITGEIVELKIMMIPADPAHATKLLVKVTDDVPCSPSAARSHGTSP